MTSVQTKDFLSGGLKHVDVQGIEKELFRLWDEADKEFNFDSSPRVTRACSLNFIAFSSNDDWQDKLEDMVAEIAIKHPSRAILAFGEDSEVQSMDAWVTARCSMVGGKPDKQICCEQIIVKWKGSGTRNLVSVVAPLTIPDLPTCMWWHDSSLDLEKIRPFLPHTDRFIVDSYELNTTKPAVFQLQSLKDSMVEGSGVYDLNWVRTLPWRQSLAHSFDPRWGPLTTEDLDIISELEIVEESSENSSNVNTQSILLLGWLASKLNWKLVDANIENDGISAVYRLNRTSIKARIRKHMNKPGYEFNGNLRQISIKLRNESRCSLHIWPDKACPGLSTERVKDVSQREKEISYKPVSQVELIDTILNYPKKPTAFEDSVTQACEVVRQIR